MTRIKGDLKNRSFDFGLSVLSLADQLPNNVKGWVVGKQLIRSGTSVGSNVREADNAHSDADFAYKCSVARKESAETHYWLELCVAAGLLKGEETKRVLCEADELARITSTIVLRTQQHIARSP
jgi:four helix bundle protein